jgi:DNA-binding transcriptional MerR regulator
MEHFELKAGQVAAVVGIDARQLQNAVEAGYVRPSVLGRGRGSVRLYSFEDVVRLRVFDILVRAYGMEQERAARMLSSAWPRRLTAGRQTLCIVPTKASSGRGVSLVPITIPLGDIVMETERRIGRVRKSYRERKNVGARSVGQSGFMKCSQTYPIVSRMSMTTTSDIPSPPTAIAKAGHPKEIRETDGEAWNEVAPRHIDDGTRSRYPL